jgi:hypothetical protein
VKHTTLKLKDDDKGENLSVLRYSPKAGFMKENN